MQFKKGKTYKVKLLRDAYGTYDITYGKKGEVVELTHFGSYRGHENCLYVIEGHGYGSPFYLGEDIELLEEKNGN